jgi:DNA (cytosine-5)-methyltransferase 1
VSHVDTNTITHVSLCSGYGGIDLGLKRAIGRSLRTVAYVEVESFAVANLVAKASQELLDEAPVWSDLRSFPWGKFHGLVDILSGGYPCQPFSSAGKRLGAEDPRHLWPHISTGIAAMRPALCFFENVQGHISLGLRDVLQDLVGLGYRATWCVASASECCAPHQRKRVFILAHRHGERGQLPDWWRDPAEQVPVGYGETWRDGQWPSRPGEPQHAWEPPRVVGNATSQRPHRGTQDGLGLQSKVFGEGHEAMGNANELRPQGRHDTGSLQAMGISRAELTGANGKHNGRQTQSPLGRDADGPADWLDDAELYTTCDNRTDELRVLGNGVVPACAERAFRILIEELMT